jgi:hypothetical protein
MINNQPAPPPSEPSVIKQAAELRNYLETLDTELVTLHEGLFHPLPEKENSPKQPQQLTLQDLISQACTSAAQTVGLVRTINSRLGFGNINASYRKTSTLRSENESPLNASTDRHWSGH